MLRSVLVRQSKAGNWDAVSRLVRRVVAMQIACSKKNFEMLSKGSTMSRVW
jgi:hypothetical protein